MEDRIIFKDYFDFSNPGEYRELFSNVDRKILVYMS